MDDEYHNDAGRKRVNFVVDAVDIRRNIVAFGELKILRHGPVSVVSFPAYIRRYHFVSAYCVSCTPCLVRTQIGSIKYSFFVEGHLFGPSSMNHDNQYASKGERCSDSVLSSRIKPRYHL